MNAIQTIFQPYLEGRAAIILSGRDPFDLEVNEKNQLTPLLEILREEAFKKHQLVLIEYSKSSGITYDLRLLNAEEKSTVTRCLNEMGLCTASKPGADSNDPEFARIIRGLIKLSQADNKILLRDGVPVRFCFLIHYTEHLTPSLQTGTHSEEQILSIETALRLSKSLAVRKYRNYIIFYEARPGTLESLLYQNVPVVNLPQPDSNQKIPFIAALKNRYPKAELEDNLDDAALSVLSSGTPNRTLESIFIKSDNIGEQIKASDVFARKQEDIISLSEHTLEPIQLDRVKNLNLVGTTIQKALKILFRITEGLKKNDPNTLRNILLAGAPATGKTMLANFAAARAGVPSFNFVTPKSQYVGESERKIKLCLDIFKQNGGIGIADEIECLMPLNKDSFNGDSGVTSFYTAQLQNFLSDPSISGKCAIVGTTNRPSDISSAMLTRWLVVPVLMPVSADFPAIVESIARSLNPSIELDLNNQTLHDSAIKFFQRGATPREIREALIASCAVLDGPLSIKHIEDASAKVIPNVNRLSYYYADYCALQHTRNLSFLPWYNDDTNQLDDKYPFPDYIREVLNDDLQIDFMKLNNKIKELQPYANV
jgi:SpoVK/Ycf46/Vps4 family AAA+-type ATPase